MSLDLERRLDAGVPFDLERRLECAVLLDLERRLEDDRNEPLLLCLDRYLLLDLERDLV